MTERTIRRTLKGAAPRLRKQVRQLAASGDATGVAALLITSGYADAGVDIATEITAERDRAARIFAAHEEARGALANGCPCCGRKVRQNLALTGWVQCEQYGAPGFRADASAPACNWQGFTR